MRADVGHDASDQVRFAALCRKLGVPADAPGSPAVKDELKRKIEQATKYVPLENLSISPQCGFASHQKGSGLSFAQQEAKLRLVVQTATEVWGSA